MESKYEAFVRLMQKKADVESSIAVLSWDKETYMPKDGVRFRSQQIATLSGIAHDLFTSQELGDLIEELNGQQEQLSPEAARNIVLTNKDYQRGKKLSNEFVVRRSMVCSNAYHKWVEAKAASDFSLFQAALEEVVKIKREEAEIMGYEGHPYNALLEDFEPNYTAEMLDVLFEDVKAKLVDFVKAIRAQPQVGDEFMFKHYDKDKQWAFSLKTLKQLGYNFDAGRQDWSPHPFTINFSPQDVRVTTRVDEKHLGNLLWSSIHECGHALYEQGLPVEQYGLPVGRHISLGIHESQSRLWENNVGRSLTFWKACYGDLQAAFPAQLGDVDLMAFYKGMNKIEPTLIRTEADELHYHFHILIRYELEKALIEDNLKVADLEGAWNEKYKAYLDVDVPNAKEGVLQDIHWSYGNIGYFPTYSLGSFYAAQFYQQAQQSIPNLESEMAQGNTAPLLQWLQENIYQQGRKYSATELCTNLTGEPLNFQYFYDSAVAKYSQIYEL